ncbi:selenoprotein M isoform X2 [Balearica regulorum gibbericeps]|uniref:selenoprotein M isoform X2 n=1 Tax=Balearica regulorum gibbericeps TaxID=100784 RepID=UPI003F62819F
MLRALPLSLLVAALAAGGGPGPPRPRGAELRGLARGKVEVKAFVTQDIPLYHNLEMKHLPGADPELVLLSHRYEELERIPLSDMTREEINQLVQELGFYRKETPDAPVPEEFQFAPARPLSTLLPRQAPTTDSKTLPERDEGEHPDL